MTDDDRKAFDEWYDLTHWKVVEYDIRYDDAKKVWQAALEWERANIDLEAMQDAADFLGVVADDRDNAYIDSERQNEVVAILGRYLKSRSPA